MLTRVGITARLLSLHEHNEARTRRGDLRAAAERGQRRAGHRCGHAADQRSGLSVAGGGAAAGLPVSPVPGPCAAIAALSVAGLPTDRFFFEGFLPARSAARLARLRELAGRAETLVFYEAANRMADTLADALAVFGPERAAAVGRELTKLHETVYRGSLAEVRAAVLADPGGERGECTWVLAGRRAQRLRRTMPNWRAWWGSWPRNCPRFPGRRPGGAA